jgi:hypothetical protein
MSNDKKTFEKRDVRINRDLSDRESEKRTATWAPPTVLPVPEQQDGYSFRWVRTAMRNEPDNMNFSRKLREGWEPVRIDDHPELKVLPDIDTRFEGNVVVGGLMLCKIATEILDQKRAYNESQAATQVEAVENNYLREQDARMPMLPSERSTRVTFGDGS